MDQRWVMGRIRGQGNNDCLVVSLEEDLLTPTTWDPRGQLPQQ